MLSETTKRPNLQKLGRHTCKIAEEEDQKYHLLQAKRKKNPFWNEQTLGMENLEQRLKEQHHHQKLDQQLEAIRSQGRQQGPPRIQSKKNLQQSAKPVAKRKLVIPNYQTP